MLQLVQSLTAGFCVSHVHGPVNNLRQTSFEQLGKAFSWHSATLILQPDSVTAWTGELGQTLARCLRCIGAEIMQVLFGT